MKLVFLCLQSHRTYRALMSFLCLCLPYIAQLSRCSRGHAHKVQINIYRNRNFDTFREKVSPLEAPILNDFRELFVHHSLIQQIFSEHVYAAICAPR
jgi:hypothetical protein